MELALHRRGPVSEKRDALSLSKGLPPRAAQENEKKHKREMKETPEELAECDLVFADF